MEGAEIIQSAIGQRLESGKLQSFILNGELVDRINVTFLKFNNWVRITSTDEKTKITLEGSSSDKGQLNVDKEFRYPVEDIILHFPEFRKFIGKRLIDYKELVLKSNESLSFGVNLFFEDDLNFLIHNQDYPIDKNEYLFENLVPENLKEK
ncbi:hypothetical protein [Pontibacter virosus]|uniref:Uncharacterized protein n=1 Tax=Pontibacter virosus TaxID=1765052 RepID=A0A2U1AH04_9BACT|nr:hypothetical protein [Pontibacter virosus]PVY35667.1 hypothetical protein C8E01_1314 [Pontibacter virosus]